MSRPDEPARTAGPPRRSAARCVTHMARQWHTLSSSECFYNFLPPQLAWRTIPPEHIRRSHMRRFVGVPACTCFPGLGLTPLSPYNAPSGASPLDHLKLPAEAFGPGPETARKELSLLKHSDLSRRPPATGVALRAIGVWPTVVRLETSSGLYRSILQTRERQPLAPLIGARAGDVGTGGGISAPEKLGKHYLTRVIERWTPTSYQLAFGAAPIMVCNQPMLRATSRSQAVRPPAKSEVNGGCVASLIWFAAVNSAHVLAIAFS